MGKVGCLCLMGRHHLRSEPERLVFPPGPDRDCSECRRVARVGIRGHDHVGEGTGLAWLWFQMKRMRVQSKRCKYLLGVAVALTVLAALAGWWRVSTTREQTLAARTALLRRVRYLPSC